MKLGPLLSAAAHYLKENPEEIVRAAINAAGLRFGIPLAAFRRILEELAPGKKMPTDIEIGASPPALRLAGTVDAMGTQVRASAAIRVEEVFVSGGEFRVAVRVSEVKLAVLGEGESPIAALIKSGALDLSNPGNLVNFIPKKPEAIVEAKGDRIVVDLMRIPAFASNHALHKALSVIAPVLSVRAIETDQDYLYLALKASPGGIMEAVGAIVDK